MVLLGHAVGNAMYDYLAHKVQEEYAECFKDFMEDEWEMLAKIINKLHENCCNISVEDPNLHGSHNCNICKYVEDHFTKRYDQKWMDTNRDKTSDPTWIRKAIITYKSLYIYKENPPHIEEGETYSETLRYVMLAFIEYEYEQTNAGKTFTEEDQNLLDFILQAIDEFEKIKLSQKKKNKNNIKEEGGWTNRHGVNLEATRF